VALNAYYLGDTSALARITHRSVAEAAGLVVLHYDHDFDLISDVSGQSTEWIVPAGTVS
jgi:hypothetical protein